MIYAEGFGNNILGSINYERFLSRGESATTYLRAGFAMAPEKYANLRTKLGYAPLLMLVTQRGLKRIKFELGIGGGTALGGYTRAYNLQYGLGNYSFNWYITGTLGLRYTGKNGLFLKIGYTPFYSFIDKSFIWLWGGTSIGYTFKEKEKRKPVSPLDKLEALPNNIIRYPIDQHNEEAEPQSIKKGGVLLPNHKVIYPFERKKQTYPDSTKNIYYSLLGGLPTTRNYWYALGVERYQKINKQLAFCSSASFSFLPPINNLPAWLVTPLSFTACLQPFHLLIGSNRFKFETGLSLTYWNISTDNQYFSKNYRSYVTYNAFIGIRYNFKQIPFHAHLAYVPNFNPYAHKIFYEPLFNPIGFELGVGYILHKSQAALKREEIRRRVKESY